MTSWWRRYLLDMYTCTSRISWSEENSWTIASLDALFTLLGG